MDGCLSSVSCGRKLGANTKDGLDSVRISSKSRASSCQAVLRRGCGIRVFAFCDSKFVSLSRARLFFCRRRRRRRTQTRRKSFCCSPTASSHGEIIVDIRGEIGAYVYVCIAYARLACLFACLLAEGDGKWERRGRKGKQTKAKGRKEGRIIE